MTLKFNFMYLYLKQHKNGVFNLYCMPELYFDIPQVSVDEKIPVIPSALRLLSLGVFFVGFSELVQRLFGKYAGWASILMFCVFLFYSN